MEEPRFKSRKQGGREIEESTADEFDTESKQFKNFDLDSR